MKIFLNNIFVEEKDALISINDLTLNRGYGVFDFFRTSEGIPLFVDDYVDRFYQSANSLRLLVPFTKDELKNIIQQLISINQLKEVGIRMILTGGISENNFNISFPNLLIIPSKLNLPTIDQFKKGLHLMTYEYLRTLPNMKSTNYLMAIWLQDEINKNGVDDVIYTHNSQVLELPRANIFIINSKQELVTPNINILKGITRKNILTIASKFIPIKEKEITINDLMNAEEVFISSTTKRVLPVKSINKKNIGSNQQFSWSSKIYSELLQLEAKYLMQNKIS